MTEMTDLEWLARNVSEWDGVEDSDKIQRLGSGVNWCFWPKEADIGGQCYTKGQWQAKRRDLGLDAPKKEGNGVTSQCDNWGDDFIDDAPEWDDEGRPNIGTVCEAKSGSLENWYAGLCVGHDGDFVILRMQEDYPFNVVYAGFPTHRVRPLKSQEQREREGILAQAWRIMDGCDKGLSQMAAKLYDAGMLKKPD